MSQIYSGKNVETDIWTDEDKREVTIIVTDSDGNLTQFTVKARAAHVGCSVLSVRKDEMVPYEPDWVDLEEEETEEQDAEELRDEWPGWGGEHI